VANSDLRANARQALFDLFVLFVRIVRMERKGSPKRMAKPLKLTQKESQAQSAEGTAEAPEKPQAVNVPTERVPAPPEIVYADVEREPDRRQLRDYSDSIRLLRHKGFTFREIAECLNGYGVEADHNAVYRVYLRTVHPAEVAQIEQELQEEEMDGQG
jgi:hypothetical protein